MIQANELRIGNWLHYKIDEIVQPTKFRIMDDKFIQVDSIDYDHLLESELPDSYCINHSYRKYYSPIPLTPEILEKCGFGKEGDTYKIVTKNLDYCFKISFTGNGYFSQNAMAKHPILYIHQLQNLYFSLTGEELTFKP